MTQDHYGQARNAGYGDRDVVEDDTEGNPSDEGKPMTRFQKVASALRGDRPDRDETDEDEVAANQPDTVSPEPAGSGLGADSGLASSSEMATDPDVMATGQGTRPADPTWVTHPHEAAGSPEAEDARLGQETAVGPGGAAATAGTQRGDYWEVPNAHENQVAAVTSPGTPVTGTDANPLARQAETVDQTRPDLADAQAPASTQPGEYGTSGENAVAGDTETGATVPGATVPWATVAGEQPGAATISGLPVTEQDAAVTDAPGVTERHAAEPAEGLRPGEAEGTLQDLGDLAYGNLLPDASVFTEQWQQIQFRFVDDPQASVTEAAEVVAQVTAKLEAAIQERQRAIEARQQVIQERQRSLRGRWGEGTQADTETLRETLRMYRAFLDQLIGPKA